MALLSKQQLITANTLISKLGISPEQKREIIFGFTSGRSGSSKDLTHDEAVLLIGHLKSLDPDEKKAEIMRRKVISMAHEIGWHQPGTNKIDMPRLDGWCKKFGYLKKGLNAYTLSELPKLVTQFEKGPYAYILNR